jgi:hypothetical protein
MKSFLVREKFKPIYAIIVFMILVVSIAAIAFAGHVTRSRELHDCAKYLFYSLPLTSTFVCFAVARSTVLNSVEVFDDGIKKLSQYKSPLTISWREISRVSISKEKDVETIEIFGADNARVKASSIMTNYEDLKSLLKSYGAL